MEGGRGEREGEEGGRRGRREDGVKGETGMGEEDVVEEGEGLFFMRKKLLLLLLFWTRVKMCYVYSQSTTTLFESLRRFGGRSPGSQLRVIEGSSWTSLHESSGRPQPRKNCKCGKSTVFPQFALPPGLASAPRQECRRLSVFSSCGTSTLSARCITNGTSTPYPRSELQSHDVLLRSFAQCVPVSVA